MQTYIIFNHVMKTLYTTLQKGLGVRLQVLHTHRSEGSTFECESYLSINFTRRMRGNDYIVYGES